MNHQNGERHAQVCRREHSRPPGQQHPLPGTLLHRCLRAGEPGHLLYLLPADGSMPMGRTRRVERIGATGAVSATVTVVTVNSGDFQMIEIWLDHSVDLADDEEVLWYMRFDRVVGSGWKVVHLTCGQKKANRPTSPGA